MGRRNEVKDHFAELLKKAISERFGMLPSNAVIAREFNLRAYGTEPVTQESVRRWLKGICMPDETKLRILVSWLDLDLKVCFNHNGADLSTPSHLGTVLNGGQQPIAPAPPKSLRADQLRLLKLLDSLPSTDRKLVEELAKKLSTRVNA
jgi:hypothetical protein